MLSVSSGYSPEYLLREIATGRESYYTGAVTEGEPPGRWWGAGAEKLGLVGEVDAQDMRAVYERFLDPRADGFGDPARWDELADSASLGHTGRRYATEDELYAQALEREPDASAERRAELKIEAGQAARHNVAFLDVTFSVQKSVTVLHTAFEAQQVNAERGGDLETAAAWGAYRQAVEDAIWAGNNAALSYLSEHAGYARVGHHGGAAGRWVDAHDWVVSSFFQHDSRDHDPQLHIHNPVLNRVQGPDGQWRTLDSRAIHKFRPAAAAVAERTTEEHLARALGIRVAMRPDGKAREVLGVDEDVTDLLSSRRRAVSAKAGELIAEFEARHGREANGLERDRLSRQATLATRQAKSHEGETREQLLDRINAAVRAEVAGGLNQVALDVLAAHRDQPPPAAQSWTPREVLETALADVQSRKAAWTRADFTRAINDALPDTIGLADGVDVAELLDTLTDEGLALATPLHAPRPGDAALPDDLRVASGASAYDAPGAALYATPAHIHTERALSADLRRGDAAALPGRVADRFLDGLAADGIVLGADQAAAVRGVLTSGARVETLVGPAGTGKSFVVGTLARAWTDPALRGPATTADGAGRVFGLAASQIATDVLADEGLTARNITRWLATQERLTAVGGRPHEADAGWALRAGDMVVVDESAMADTPSLRSVHDHVERAGAKLLLVGDHRQLAAVGAGGAMELITAQGAGYELADARRFHSPWEGPASLRLRDGDPDALQDYHRAGRVLDAGRVDDAEASAARAWLADTLAGRQSVLVVDTNDQADRLSAHLRAELVRLGRVDEHGAALGRDGNTAGVGDMIAARRNGWHLAGHRVGEHVNERAPINRETFRVTAVGDDGSLTVAPISGRDPGGNETHGPVLVLPADYVADDVTLAYAGTVHSTQGRTVDTSHLVAGPTTSRAAAYVGLTRGREANTAHVVTVTGPTDPADGDLEHHSLHRDPLAVLAGVITDDPTRDSAGGASALATAVASLDDASSTRTAGELFADAAALAATDRTARALDALTADGVLTEDQRTRLAAEDGAASLARILRRAEIAGHDPDQVLHDAVAGRPLDGARTLTNVIHGRIRDAHTFDPIGTTWADWTPRTGRADWDAYLGSLAEAADRGAETLAEELAADPPPWLTDALGPAPDDAHDRDAWSRNAAAVAGWRELRGHNDPEDALGPAPGPGQVESYASYRAAWRALGRPEIDREELELSDGQLRVRVRAHEREATWAPRYVAHELAGTHQAADRARADAHLRRAEASTAPDEQRPELLEHAAQADALAHTLDERARALAEVDDARARWLAHTAGTRAAAERAKAELAARHADDAEVDPTVTAGEWLAAHRADLAAEEPHRDITEHDVTDDTALDAEATDDEDDVLAENADRDLRQTAAGEPAPVDDDIVRVPTADETADAVGKANRALVEMRARDEADAEEERAHRADQLDHWHDNDQGAQDVAEAFDLDDGADLDEVRA